MSYGGYRKMCDREGHTGLHLWEPIFETPLFFQPAKERNCWKNLHFFSLHRCPVPISNISSRLLSLCKHSTFEAKEQVLNDGKQVSTFTTLMVLRAKEVTKLFVFTEGQCWALHFLNSHLLYYSFMFLKFFSSALLLQPYQKTQKIFKNSSIRDASVMISTIKLIVQLQMHHS